MTISFYLFDVNHGQCAAIETSSNQWCIFDLGNKSDFSPCRYIGRKAILSDPRAKFGLPPQFRFLKATISHFHGDHLFDLDNLIKCDPYYLKTPDYDNQYLIDSKQTCSTQLSIDLVDRISAFRQDYYANSLPHLSYSGISILELSLSALDARQVSTSTNSKVNNASVITRIGIYGKSILLCGDMEKEAWEAILNQNDNYGQMWRDFVSNIDILVAPHHGHSSGYSPALMSLSQPKIVLASAVQKDSHVDSMYSNSKIVSGLNFPNEQSIRYMISTREKGHIRIDFGQYDNGFGIWTFGDDAIL